ncbi:hypothetical protein BD626DRAFT_570692 [Schizophyllum amplum]|uniref:Uncharacterized protein n=1 Tax=Schizophyllum amplum TaxID=97359 RepID=A0A550C9V5_9AGAR|nr:hypothetical protein BD626DRAFT_570692 [Auriculariopsis ampla]
MQYHDAIGSLRQSTSLDQLPCPRFDDREWLTSLRIGAQPSDAERVVLEAEYNDLQTAAGRYAKELGRIQTVLTRLQEDATRRASFLYSPIRRLPDEIMTDILLFVWTSCEARWRFKIDIKPQNFTDLPALLPSRQYPPSHVCSWWRRLVLQTPSTRPYFELDIRAFDSMPVGSLGLGEDLERSLACLPYSDMNIHVETGTLPLALAKALRVHADRWQRAVLQNCSWESLQTMTQWQLSRLQHVHIGLGHETEEDDETWTSVAVNNRPFLLGQASQLYSLSLSKAADSALQMLPFTFPWLQIHFMRVQNCPLRLCTEILSMCKALRKFTWVDSRDDSEVVRQDVAPLKRSVSSVDKVELYLEEVGTLALNNLLEWIIMPRLTDLDAYLLPADPLISFVRQSNCRLTTLNLVVAASALPSLDIRKTLAALPELEVLSFEYDTQFDAYWPSVVDGETMDNFMQELVSVLRSNERPLHATHLPGPLTYLRRLEKLVFCCAERCEIYVDLLVAGRDIGASVVPPPALKEIWLETPLNKKCIERIRILSSLPGAPEINGLSKCAEMYDALMPHDWEAPPTSRKDDPLEEIDHF